MFLFILGLSFFEKSFTIAITKYSTFLGFLVTIIIAIITFYYYLATKKIAEKTEESLIISKLHRKETKTVELINEWNNSIGSISIKRKKYGLIMNNKKEVQGLGRDNALNFIEDYKQLLSYFSIVNNLINKDDINLKQYFDSLGIDIIYYYENHHIENREVFEKVRIRIEDKNIIGITIPNTEKEKNVEKVYSILKALSSK